MTNGAATQAGEPDCRKCAQDMLGLDGWPLTVQRMFLCPNCGNKRCPKATDHVLECSGSNLPGQTGSFYE